nr:immunoglobulin heavy chain junction region [Macaca mulatta]MPN69625.1 immunoglobulin heavy chain junction region [Macaca mulatta]MPN70087.1 immunoglobulin heavy chain junction region [Macaca mulatta]MPN71579.1 immunoglobulin heavy chain junction region [Macaca mulatta]MPN71866.1 immunoglobulin heavy chain junction region [Macaca mulatta]
CAREGGNNGWFHRFDYW